MGKEHDLKPKMLFYKNVQRIVESLKMIAAVKSKHFMHKNRHANNFLSNYKSNIIDYSFPFNKHGPKLNLLVGANKGLCGNYLSSLNILMKENMNSLNDKWILIGHKLPATYKKIEKNNIVFKTELEYSDESIHSIMDHIITLQPSEINVFGWLPKASQASKQKMFDDANEHEEIYLKHSEQEMDEEWSQITHNHILFGKLILIITGAIMMEETCRLYAMDQAVRNGDKIIADLKNKINQARQQGITTELNEIISGCEYSN